MRKSTLKLDFFPGGGTPVIVVLSGREGWENVEARVQ